MATKHTNAQVKPGTIVKAFCFCSIFVAVAVGYVWQKGEIDKLGRQTKIKENYLEDLRRKNESMKRTVAALSSPRDLDARVKKMNLGLTSPLPDQIVRLNEPTVQKAGASEKRLYADGRSSAGGMITK